jgi:D-3-phosphoglycerate dehydrogenase
MSGGASLVPTFNVGVTRDFLGPDGVTIGWGDIGLEALDATPWIDWAFLPTNAAELTAADVADCDALLVNSPRITAETVADNSRLAVIARFGVGYDNVDVQACAANGILVTNTPNGVRRPVASSVLCLLLALAHRLLDKDNITRNGRWNDRLDMMGRSLTCATVGLVGYGNIGNEVARLLEPLSVRLLVTDPRLETGPVPGAPALASAVDLNTLLRESDFVVLLCPLTRTTFHLIGAAQLSLMKDTSYLVNVSRGQVVDELALVDALRSRKLLGAALDVFESEPLDARSALLDLPQVILTPHSLCWNDEMARCCGSTAIGSMIQVSQGQAPEFIVERSALTTAACVRRLATYAAARTGV